MSFASLLIEAIPNTEALPKLRGLFIEIEDGFGLANPC